MTSGPPFWLGLAIRGQVGTAIRGQVTAGTSYVFLVFRSPQQRQGQSLASNSICQSPRDMLVFVLLTIYKDSKFLLGPQSNCPFGGGQFGSLDGPYKAVNSLS